MEFLLIFVLGLIVGSFLNVVILRVRSGTVSPWWGRSFCPECKTKLKWYDLVPIFSFIYLRGRCRYCHKKISWQYPAVELLSGFLWLAVFYKTQLDGNFQFSIFNFQYLNIFYEIFIFSALLIIAIYDFKWQIIPDKIVYPAIAAALIFNLFEISKYQNIAVFFWPLLVASAAFLFFFAFYYFSKGKAMGFGDAKLAFLIGLFLSPLLAVAAFVIAFIIGAVFGIILIGLGRKSLKSQIAFGPFLVLGAAIAFFFSNFIIKFFQP